MSNYTFETPVGTFLIRPIAKKTYGLLINNYLLGSYRSPDEAAEDVYKNNSGCHEWDDCHGESQDTPVALSGWVQIEQIDLEKR